MALVRTAAAELAPARADGAILRVVPDPRGRPTLAWFPLDGGHPLELLLRFIAPAAWWAIGVCASGWAHELDDHGRQQRGPASESPTVEVTVLVARTGAAAGLLRQGDQVTELPGHPEGVVADACRRALGLPTGPPPEGSTARLWAQCWLDRIVEAAAQPGGRRRVRSWRAVASLHPAVGPRLDLTAADPPAHDPARLAELARRWSEAWPWPRLRAEPAAVDLPWLDRTPALAAWMDDGMWARWLLSALPHLDDLQASVHDLVSDLVAARVDRVIEASCTG
jgi:hypothetical protein